MADDTEKKPDFLRSPMKLLAPVSDVRISLVVHGGEVLLVLNPATGLLAMTPQMASSLGAQLVEAADQIMTMQRKQQGPPE